MFDRALPYVWYPLVTAAGIAAFALMLGSGAPLPLAAYLPVIVVGAAIVLLEWRFPEHRSWRPRWADLRADAAFMAVVQIALPRLLAAAVALALAAWMHQRAPSGWWPHHWPLAAQAVVMVLAVDFVRYWIHRACHHYPVLWRLHEVHHSPDILYVLNVGRFHPLEKALHFCADTLPFIALGVAPELIACLLPALFGQRTVPAQQRAPALRVAQLRGGQRGNAPLASRARSEGCLLQLRQHHHRVGPPGVEATRVRSLPFASLIALI